MMTIEGFPGPASSMSQRLRWAAEHGPEHLRPLYTAASKDGAALCFVVQTKQAFPASPRRPSILLIGDDLDKALGPAGFNQRSLRRYFRTCSTAVVVSSEPIVAAYEAGARMAGLGFNAVIIETRPEQEIPWLSFIQKHAPAAKVILCTVKGGTA